MRRRVVLVLALALALPACGGGDGMSEDEREVRSTVDDLYEGFAEQDAGRICGLLARKQREVVAKGGGTRAPASCEQVMGVALNYVSGKGLEDADEAKVTKVAVKGRNATATVKFKGRPARIGLLKEGGEWRVSDLNLKQL